MPCLVSLFAGKLLNKCCPSIRQRHFLVLMCMCGVLLTTLNNMAFYALLSDIMYGQRSTIGSVNAVCPSIVNNEPENITTGNEEIMWGSNVVGYISVAWPLGNLLGRVPAGMIADKYGSKTLFGYSVFVPAICTLLTPLCTRTSPYLVMASRIVMGIFSSAQMPAVAWFAARWFPKSKSCLMLALVYLGFPAAFILRVHLVHLTYHVTSNWASLYYGTAVFSILWLYLWQAHIWDDPFSNPHITEEELELLSQTAAVYANHNQLNPRWSWPWRAMLSSCPVWSLSLAYLGYAWFAHFTIIILTTMYFNGVHKFNFEKNPFVVTYLYLLMAMVMVAAGAINDVLVKTGTFTVTHVTKANYAVGSIIGSVFILGLSTVGCHTAGSVMYYLGAIACVGVAFNAQISACVHVAPNLVGTTVALTTVLGEAATFLQLQLVHSITHMASLKHWVTAALINAAVCIFSTAVFMKTGRCAPEHWNQPGRKKKLKNPLPKRNTKRNRPQHRDLATTQSLPSLKILEGNEGEPSSQKKASAFLNMLKKKMRRAGEV